MVDRGDGTSPNTGIAAIDAMLPQVQNLGGISLPALSLPTTPNTQKALASGPIAVPKVITGTDGLPHTVYIDTSNGQVINDLKGYSIASANGTTVQVPATTSVPTDTGGVPPAQTTNATHTPNGGGALNAAGGSPSGSGNRGSTNPMNNFGYVSKPGFVGAFGMLPGGLGIAAKAINAGWNANNQQAVNTARSMLGLTPNTVGQNLGGIINGNKGIVSKDVQDVVDGVPHDYSVSFGGVMPDGSTSLTPQEAATRAAMFGGLTEPDPNDPNNPAKDTTAHQSRFSQITGLPGGLLAKGLTSIGLQKGFATKALDSMFGTKDPNLPDTAPAPYSPSTAQDSIPGSFSPSAAQPGAPASPEQQTGTFTGMSSPTGPNDMNYNGAYGADMGFGWGGTNSTTDPWGGQSQTPAASPATVGSLGTPAGMANTVDGSPDNFGGYSSQSGNNNGRGANAYFSNSSPAIGNEPSNPVGNSLSPTEHQDVVSGAAPSNFGQSMVNSSVNNSNASLDQTNLGTAADSLMGGFSEQDKAAMAFAGIGELSPQHQVALADPNDPNNPAARAELGSMVASMVNRALDPAIGSVDAALTPGQYNSLAKTVTINGVVSHPLQNTQQAFSVYGPEALDTVNGVMQGAIPGVNYGATNYFNPSQVNPGWASNLQNPEVIGQHLFGTDPAMMGQMTPGTLANMAAFQSDLGNAAGGYVNSGEYGPSPDWGGFASPTDARAGYNPSVGADAGWSGVAGPDAGWGGFAGGPAPDSSGGWGGSGYGGDQASTSGGGGTRDSGYGGGGYSPGGMNSPSGSGDGSDGWGGSSGGGYGSDGSDNGNGSGGGYGGENGDTGGGGAGTRGNGAGSYGGL